MRARFLRRSICVQLLIVFMMALLFVVIDETKVSAYSYNTNVLYNPTPLSGSGWSLTYCEWNSDSDHIAEFRATTNEYPFKAVQRFTFTDRDAYRINNGEIKVGAAATFWTQPGTYPESHVKTNFYNASGVSTGSKSTNNDKSGTQTLSFWTHTVPAGTKFLDFEISNYAKKWTYPEAWDFQLFVADDVAPTYTATTPVTSPAKYKIGTKIRYQVLFTEPVVVTSAGYVKFKIGAQDFNTTSNTNCTYAGQSADGTALYYDLTLPATATLGDSLSVTITGLSGIAVKDDAGNACITIPTTPLNYSHGFFLDNKPPQATNFVSGASTNALYKAGEALEFTATFHETIWVNGAPSITLSNGKSATYVKKTTSDTNEANFSYTIASGDDIKNIAISSVDFNGIYDSVSNYAITSPTYNTNNYNTFMNNKYVSIDTKAPTTTFAAAPDGWQKAYDVILSPSDNISGVKEIYAAWTLIGGNPTYPSAANVDTNTNKIILPAGSGSYELHVKLVDRVGNIATQKSPHKYYFDFDAPTITANATKISGIDFVSSVTASATDSYSGLNTFTYSWVNESGVTLLTGTASDGISIPAADGVYILNINAADKVGNTSATVKIENLVVDSIAPVVKFTQTEGTTYSKSYTIDFTVTDEKSGVAQYYYMFSTLAEKPAADIAEWTATTATSLSTPSGVSGTYYLHIKAADKVGNVSITSTDGFNIDNAAPGVAISQDGNEGIIGRVSYDVVVTISDAITPYTELTKKYAVSESETCPDQLLDLTDNKITIDNLDRSKYLYIVASDVAANKTVFKSNPFIADTTAPSGEISKETNFYYINNNAVTVNINAADDYATDIYMQIKIDDIEGEWEDFSEQKLVSFAKSEGEHTVYVRFKDVCGNISQYWSVTYYYDITPPQIGLDYSTTTLTKEAVTVTATATDSASSAKLETASEKTFSENGSYEFIASDEAGNKARVTATIDYIDKTNPAVTFQSTAFDGKKHKTAFVTINANDANGIKELKYGVVKSGDAKGSYITCSNGQTIEMSGLNGTYTVCVIAVDNAGNSVEVVSTSIYLDNTPPVATIGYSPNSRTAQSVIASISFDEASTITNNDSLNKYTFTENGSFTFKFEDEAGNTGSQTATVTWIDKKPPVVSVALKNENGALLDSEKWTNADIVAEIIVPSDCVIEVLQFNNVTVEDSSYVTNLGGNKYKISAYGRLHYQVKDSITGTKTSGEVIIRIDKKAPEITNITYSTTAWTNGNITATITAADDYNDIIYVNGSSHTFTENGNFEFIVEDSLGNRTTKTAIVSNVDKNVPVAQIGYDNVALTNGNVTASIKFEDSGSPVHITNNNGLSNYEFTANGEFTFDFTDEAGNAGSIKAVVNNIDKTAPQIKLESSYFDFKPHKSISIKINATDANGINEVKYRFIKNGEDSSYKVCQNGETVTLNSVDGTYTLEVLVSDKVGNEKTTVSDSLILDNTTPIGSITYAPSSRTAQNVVATIALNEEGTITNNNGFNEYTFTDNGNFTFEFEDESGNTATAVAKVNWIDRNQPTATVVLSNKNWTNEDVTVTLNPQAGAVIQNVKFNGADIKSVSEAVYLITEYGTLSYEVLDVTTQTVGTGEVLIKIDRVAPSVSNIVYSNQNWTNSDVTVTVTAADVLSSVIYENGNSYTFTENGCHDFVIKDSAGNQVTKTVTVDWIDKGTPLAQISYDITNLTNKNVIALVNFDEGGSPVTITNNNGQSTYEFTANGEFTFEFTDKAGNTGKAVAAISNIDKVLPEITFGSSNFDLKKYESVNVTISATDNKGIANLKYKFVKTGEDNGEFITCLSGDTVTLNGVSGVYQIIAITTDKAGNEKTAYSQSLYLDNSAPVATINYTPSTRTAQNVIATITFDEKSIITNNGGSPNYTFTNNGEFTFQFVDELGNSGAATAKVNWIDRKAPTSKVVVTNNQGDVIGEKWINEGVTVSIIPSVNSTIEDVKFNDVLVESSDLIKNLGNNQYKVEGYGILTYTVKDKDTYLTSSGEALIKVDKTAPTVKSIIYSSMEWTNQNVTVTITGDDSLGTVSYPQNSSHTFTDNGSYEFIIEDNAGNRTQKTVTVDWIDKDTPLATVTYYVDGTLYDITKPTNINIVAKVTFSEGGSPINITNNSGKSEYIFSGNGSFTFMFADSAGNEASIKAAVSKIDKVAPTGFVTYSYTGWTNSDVDATLVATDDVNEVIMTNNPSEVYTFSKNGEFFFEFKDSAGNTGTAKASVSKIDKTVPTVEYELSTKEETPFSVYAFVTADEPVTIVNNSGKTSRQFNSNGEFTFITKDRAGNTSEITAKVENISRKTTPVVLSFSNKALTNEDIYVTITPEDGKTLIYVTNNSGQKIKKFTENGEFVFKYKNAAGIEGEAVVTVSNMDKLPPNVSTAYSHTEITKDDVVVAFKSDEEVTYPYIVVDGKYTLKENMKLRIPVTDKVGNITYVIVETKLIDKTAPVITIDNQYEVLEVGTKFDANSGVTVTDDTELDGDLVISGDYDVNAVGDYVITYTIADKAGNVSTKEKYLTVYDPNKFNVIVNGRMASQGQITVDSRAIAIKTINSGGTVKAKMLAGKNSIGDFKTKGEFIELSSQFPSEGYYTLYITDDERNSQLVYVFITNRGIYK